MKIARFNESMMDDGIKDLVTENVVQYQIVYSKDALMNRFYVVSTSRDLDVMVLEFLERNNNNINNFKYFLVKIDHKEELVSDEEIELIANANKYNL